LIYQKAEIRAGYKKVRAEVSLEAVLLYPSSMLPGNTYENELNFTAVYVRGGGFNDIEFFGLWEGQK